MTETEFISISVPQKKLAISVAHQLCQSTRFDTLYITLTAGKKYWISSDENLLTEYDTLLGIYKKEKGFLKIKSKE